MKTVTWKNVGKLIQDYEIQIEPPNAEVDEYDDDQYWNGLSYQSQNGVWHVGMNLLECVQNVVNEFQDNENKS